MNAVVVALLGGIVGLGALVVVRALFRPRAISLAEVRSDRLGRGVSASMVQQGVVVGGRVDDLNGFQGVLGRIGVRLLEAVGLTDITHLGDQLRVLDRSIERHAYEKMLGAVFGFTLPVLTAVVLAAGGVAMSPLLLLVASVGLSVAGFFYPDLPLNERVEERRREFKHAFSSYLDLVTILIAGGAGTESALEGAAEDGEGWAFVEIRNALRRAELVRSSPWEAFEELGIELGVEELQELASSVALAGAQGARIKQSLVAKAEAMRAAQGAELEASAERKTEKMLVPLIVMAFGVTLFVGYGAIQSITVGTVEPSPTTR